MNMNMNMIQGLETNSDMSSLPQLYSAETKLLWSRLGFLPQGKKMIGLDFITLAQIKRRYATSSSCSEIWRQVKEEHQGQHRHQVTLKVSHCGSFRRDSLYTTAVDHKLVDCQTKKKRKLNLYNILVLTQSSEIFFKIFLGNHVVNASIIRFGHLLSLFFVRHESNSTLRDLCTVGLLSSGLLLRLKSVWISIRVSRQHYRIVR